MSLRTAAGGAMAALRLLGRVKKQRKGTILVTNDVSTVNEIVEEEAKSLASSLEEASLEMDDPEVARKKEAKWKVLDKAVRDGKTDKQMEQIEADFETRWLEENGSVEETEDEQIYRIESRMTMKQKAERRNTVLEGEDVLEKARVRNGERTAFVPHAVRSKVTKRCECVRDMAPTP